jgi:hypothetical protein
VYGCAVCGKAGGAVKGYLKYHIFEYILCIAMTAALLVNFSQGFYIPDKVADSGLIAVLAVSPILAVCFLAGFNRVTRAAVPAIMLVAVAVAIFLMREGAIIISDTENSDTAIYIYAVAAIVISVVVYLLSRTRIGIGVLFVCGATLGAVIDFMQYDVKIWCCVLFPLAAIIMFALRQYRISALNSSTVAPNFKAFFVSAAALVLAATVLAGSAFSFIIKPLDMPTMDISLLTKYLSYETLKKLGIADSYPIPDDMLKAREPDSGTIDSSEEELPQDERENEEQEKTDTELDDNAGGGNGDTEKVSSVSYGVKPTPYIIAGVAIFALILAAIPITKRTVRKRFFANVKNMTSQERTIALYRFYLTRFKKLGYGKLPSQTELEYADRIAEPIGSFTGKGITIKELTDAYIRAR